MNPLVPVSTDPGRTSASHRFQRLSVETGIRLALILAIFVVFAASAEDFLSPGNLYSILSQFALLGLITAALGVTMIAGEFDLSVGAMVSVSAVITLKVSDAYSPIVGLLAGIATGALVGVFNGILVAFLRLSSLVVTVGTLVLLTGIAYQIANNSVVSYDNFDVSSAVDDPIAQILSARSLITIGILVLLGLVLRFLRGGRYLYAVGGNRAAAFAMGLPVDRTIVLSMTASATLAALAGGLLAFSLLGASPTTGGSLLLQGASAAMLGGIALSGGVGTATGMALGALTLTALNSGLSLQGVSSALIALINGLVLLIVIVLNARNLGTVNGLLVRMSRPLHSFRGRTENSNGR